MDRLTQRGDGFILITVKADDGRAWFQKCVNPDDGTDADETVEYRTASCLADFEDKIERGEMVEVGTPRIYTEAGNEVFMVYDGEVIQLLQCGAMIDGRGNVFVALVCNDKIFPYREGDAEHDTDPTDWCRDFIELSPDEYIKTVFATEAEAIAALPKEDA